MSGDAGLLTLKPVTTKVAPKWSLKWHPTDPQIPLLSPARHCGKKQKCYTVRIANCPLGNNNMWKLGYGCLLWVLHCKAWTTLSHVSSGLFVKCNAIEQFLKPFLKLCYMVYHIKQSQGRHLCLSRQVYSRDWPSDLLTFFYSTFSETNYNEEKLFPSVPHQALARVSNARKGSESSVLPVHVY